MRCDRCPRPIAAGPCPGERAPRICDLVASGRADYARHAAGAPSPVEPGLPPLAARVANLAGAVARHVAAGMPRADAATIATRRAACREGVGLAADQVKDGRCDRYRVGDDRCGSMQGCGCYIQVASTWRDKRCPLGRWPE